MITNDWLNCYPSNWKGVIVPEAMSHPAKYSSKLIRRIYEHMIEQGWVKEGDRVLDPFGGVALGAFDALRLGLHWTGVELESKFAGLGTVNIIEWNNKFGNMPHWGTARLLNGDSRYLLSVIGEQVQVSVSSPPYADSNQNYKDGWKRFHDGHTPLHTNDIQREAQYGTTDGQLSAMPANQFDAAISSPPYAESIQTNEKGSGIDYSKSKSGGKGRTVAREAIATGYGSSDGQLGGMKNAGFDVAISSPPFLQSEGGTPEPKAGGTIDVALYKRHSAGNAKAKGYGDATDQLSSMRDGGFAGAISSPPFGEALSGGGIAKKGYQNEEKRKGSNDEPFDLVGKRSYMPENQGETPGQLAAMPMNSFNAALSSPPYAEARIGQESGQEHCGHGDQYGESTGQLGSMPAEGFDVAVSSPPFEKTMLTTDQKFMAQVEKDKRNGSRLQPGIGEYGQTAGQLGNDSGADFWLAARAIVEQVYQALTPGGHCIWVVKDYVKNKQIVPFSAQWRQLCEAVGFVTLHEHHAMLVHHKGTQHLLEGGSVEKVTESKSFFRRLAEKKGSPRIDYETIFCMVKN